LEKSDRHRQIETSLYVENFFRHATNSRPNARFGRYLLNWQEQLKGPGKKKKQNKKKTRIAFLVTSISMVGCQIFDLPGNTDKGPLTNFGGGSRRLWGKNSDTMTFAKELRVQAGSGAKPRSRTLQILPNQRG
jgi:hypothetical protein